MKKTRIHIHTMITHSQAFHHILAFHYHTAALEQALHCHTFTHHKPQMIRQIEKKEHVNLIFTTATHSVQGPTTSLSLITLLYS